MCESKVGDGNMAIVRDENVGWFDISVHYSHAVEER